MEIFKSISRVITSVLLYGGMLSCAAPTADSGPGGGQGSDLASGISQQINAYRSSRGVRVLQRHSGLDKLARSHSEYMRSNRGKFKLDGVNVSHMGADGRSMVAMRQYNFNSTSECVAAMPKAGSNQQTAMNFFNSWKKSSTHHYALRNAEWTHTGVGVAVDSDGMVFATQIFATGGNFQMPARDRYTGF